MIQIHSIVQCSNVIKPMKKGENTAGETVSQGHVASGAEEWKGSRGTRSKIPNKRLTEYVWGKY